MRSRPPDFFKIEFQPVFYQRVPGGGGLGSLSHFPEWLPFGGLQPWWESLASITNRNLREGDDVGKKLLKGHVFFVPVFVDHMVPLLPREK